MPQFRHLPALHHFGKAHDTVVAGMYFHQSPGVFPDGPFIIPYIGLIGGAHLPQGSTAALHDLRHPEASTDLHQFPSGNHHLAPLGQSRKQQQYCSRIIVYHKSCFRSRKFAQKSFHMGIAMPPLPGFHIIFQSGVIPGCFIGCPGRPLPQTGPAQIGVQRYTGAVYHRTQRGPMQSMRPAGDALTKLVQFRQCFQFPGKHLFPKGADTSAYRLYQIRMRNIYTKSCQGGKPQQIIHFGKAAQ